MSGDTHTLLRERQDLKHRVHPGVVPSEDPWEPQDGEIHSLSKWLITWIVIQRRQGWYAYPATLWGLDVPITIARCLCPLGGKMPNCCFKNTGSLWGCEQWGTERAETFLSYISICQISTSFLSGAPSPSLRKDQLTWAGSPHIQALLPEPIYLPHLKQSLN